MTSRSAALKHRQSVIQSRLAQIEERRLAHEENRFAELYELLKADVWTFREEWQRRPRRQALTRTPERRPVSADLA
ncbi:MAG: hypothetical protein ACFBZ9_02290 [Sphingomonadales bacterium]